MKYSKIVFKNFAIMAILVSLFIACDRDFATIESDIVNNENATNFDTDSRVYDLISYTKALPPVQTNNLPLNLLGVYNDPLYGRTTSSFVTQLSTSFIEPDFGENAVLDSVVLTIPYFSTSTEVNDEGETLFELDSVFGQSPFNLKLYESNYFLRDFRPSDDINDPQVYYSNKSTGTSTISDGILEGTLIRDLSPFTHDNRQIILKDNEGEITERQVPALRVAFLPGDEDGALDYWEEKIFEKSGQPEISNQSNLNDYFRGLYFKAEPIDGFTDSNLALLNLDTTNANLIFYYTRDNTLPDSDPVQSTFNLGFAATRVNFMENEFTLSDGDPIQGDEQLFLKGGQGASAILKLFDGGNMDLNDGVVNAFEIFKNEFVEIDEEGNFVKSKKLVNEANLVIYVDRAAVTNLEEPDRIYLFDTKNNSPLIDYFFDTANTLSPTDSRTNHLGKLERDDNDRGIRYKIRITEHINNLLVRDSTNIELGLVVSGNINLESNAEDFDLLNPNDDNDKLPVSSIITPRSTVLFGNNTTEEEKKLYLEIFFTEPNN